MSWWGGGGERGERGGRERMSKGWPEVGMVGFERGGREEREMQ